jgi:diguanylate cyclase (GGDEF)-like protein
MVNETPKAIVGLIVVSVIFIWGYHTFIPLNEMLIWILLQSIFIFFRYWNAHLLKQHLKDANDEKTKKHTVFFCILIIYSSLVWSGGSILGFMYAPSPYELVSLTMIAGIIAAGALSLSPILNAYLGYFTVMVLVQLFIMLMYDDKTHMIVTYLFIIYIPLIFLLSKSIYRFNVASIENTEKLEENVKNLYEISIIDSLTGVYNRRYFFESAQRHIALAQRDRADIALLMLDIDHFKNINDTYGHQAGDSVLRELSQALHVMIRESDLFARVGGEEFTILLHNTKCDGAKVMSEKIRSSIQQHPFKFRDITINVTLSIGIAALNDSVNTLDLLYQEADAQLYQAKISGRNRVCFSCA